jgi:hypothetical protein
VTVITTPESGVGITLGYRLTGSGSFTPVGLLMDDCEFSGFETNVIPLPILASATLTKTPGRTDYGSFSGSLYFVPNDTGVAEFLTLAAARTPVSWQVQLPDGTTATTGTTLSWGGFISSVKPGNFTGEDAPHLDFEIQISGAVTVGVAT